MRNGSSQAWSIKIVLVATIGVICWALVSTSAATTEDDGTDGTCDNPDNVTYPRQVGSLLLYHFLSVSSTQDEAKRLIETNDIPEGVSTVVVTATEQTNGRGTSGRQWMGARGNTLVTICIRQSDWMSTSLSMTLLPVRIGIIMAERIDELLQSCKSTTKATTSSSLPAMTTIKWPNDVLVDENKISGVLIEMSSNSWFLIGIGVNIKHAPMVPLSGPNHGRKATSIANYCPQIVDDEAKSVQIARQLGEDMAHDLSRWLVEHRKSKPPKTDAETKRILQSWKEWVDWDVQLVLRDAVERETVTPVDIEPDGRLRVKGSNGTERLIVTDYFL